MEIKQTAILTQEDIAYAIRDYLKAQGYGVYSGTFKWKYAEKNEVTELKHVECGVFTQEEEAE